MLGAADRTGRDPHPSSAAAFADPIRSADASLRPRWLRRRRQSRIGRSRPRPQSRAAFSAPPILIDEPLKRPSRPTLKAVFRDRLRMTPAAKTALERSYKEIRRGHHMPEQEVLLTVLELDPPDPAAELLDLSNCSSAA